MGDSVIKIGVDLDECIYDWWAQARRALKILRNVQPTNPTRYILHGKDIGISQEDWEWLGTDPAALEIQYAKGYPHEGALHGMAMLENMGELVIVTQRPAGTEEYTKHWLTKWGLDKHDFLFLGAAWGQKAASKREALCAFYVDDSPAVCIDLMARGLPVIKINRPWNKWFHPLSNLYSEANDWNGIVNKAVEVAEWISSNRLHTFGNSWTTVSGNVTPAVGG